MLDRIWRGVRALGRAGRRLARSKSGLAGGVILGFWLTMMLIALLWDPSRVTDFHLSSALHPPSGEFPFGTDKYGRDVMWRVLGGSKDVILLSLSGTALALFLGASVGLLAGYSDGWFGEVIMRLMDIAMAFPSILLACMVLGVLGSGAFNVVMVIGVVFAPRVARVARSAVLEVKTKEFVEAAKGRGESSAYLMVVEILPNIVAPIGVEFSVRFAYAVFLSASLGFLGLGVQPPAPDWGLMVSEGRDFIQVAPWVVLFPALAISSLVVGVNLFSEAVRQIAEGEI